MLFSTQDSSKSNESKVARSREKNCADRAKFLLDEMGRLYNEGYTELLPRAVSFGAIINAVSIVHIFANSFTFDLSS